MTKSPDDISHDESAGALTVPPPPPFNLPSGGTLFANPYGEEFYLYMTTESNKTATVNVISGLDTLLLTQESPVPVGGVYVPPGQNLNVWGDTVVIRGPLVLPGRSVTIWARTLQWQADVSGNPAKIDVSGVAPVPAMPAVPKAGQAANGANSVVDGMQYSTAQPGTPGNPGANGNTAADSSTGSAFTPATGDPAGNITIYAGNLSDALAPGMQLAIMANGGNGQNGQDAQAGQDAGNGGHGMPYYGETVDSWPVWPAPRPTPGASGGPGGTGGTGGAGATGGTAGKIIVASLNATKTTSISCTAQGGAGGTGGAGANGGNGGYAGPNGQGASGGGTGGSAANGGNGGAGGVGGASGTINWYGLTPASTNVVSGTGGNGGAYGAPGNPGPGGGNAYPGSTPNPSAGGAAGQASALSSYNYSTLALNTTALQCSMMLQKANLNYLSADPKTNPGGFESAAVLYNWLQWVIYPIVQSGSSAPPGNNFSPPELAILLDVYSQAQAMANQLVLRHDYFGNLFSYVPRVSYKVQQMLLNQMVAAFQGLESGYISYFDLLQKNQATYNEIVGQESATSTQITNTQEQLNTLVKNAKQIVDTLNRQLSEIKSAITVMDEKVQAYRQELIRQAIINGCANASIDMMKLVCQTLTGAVTGNVTGLVAELAGKVTDAAVEQTMSAAGKALGNNKDILSSVQALLEDIATLSQVYAQNPNNVTNGTYKLLVEDQTALQKQLAKYTSVLPNNAAGKAALDAINHFIDVVQQRNVNVVQYNSDLSQYVSLNSTLAKLREQLDQIQNLPTNANPGLPWIVSFMARLYHTVRSEILYQMYLTGRALGYWGLDPSTAGLSSFVNVSDPAAINSSTLSGASIALLGAFNGALEAFGTGALTTFPAQGQKQGIIVPFTEQEYPARLAALMVKTSSNNNNAGYVYTVSLPIQTVTQKTPAQGSPFADWSNVRISTARPWVVGAKTTSGNLTVAITHNGAEGFADLSNNLMWFTHEPITATFKFQINNNAILRDSDGFGTIHSGSGGYYDAADFAPPGPFTMWTIMIDPDQNPGLDVSGVTAINLEFLGAGYSFAGAKPQE